MKKKYILPIFIAFFILIILIIILNYKKIIYIFESDNYKLCNMVNKKYINNYEAVAKKALENKNGINTEYLIYNKKDDYKLNIKEDNIFIELNKKEDVLMKEILNNSMKTKISHINIYDKIIVFYSEDASCAIVKTSNIEKSAKFLKNNFFKKNIVYLKITDNWYKITKKKV